MKLSMKLLSILGIFFALIISFGTVNYFFPRNVPTINGVVSESVITHEGGIALSSASINNNGIFTATVSNTSLIWRVTNVEIGLIDSAEYADVKNGQRRQAYTETYHVKLNVQPGSAQQFKIPTRWTPGRGYLVYWETKGAKNQ